MEYKTHLGRVIFYCIFAIITVCRIISITWFYWTKYAGRPNDAFYYECIYHALGSKLDKDQEYFDDFAEREDYEEIRKHILDSFPFISSLYYDIFRRDTQLVAFILSMFSLATIPPFLFIAAYKKNVLNEFCNTNLMVNFFAVLHIFTWFAIGTCDNLPFWIVLKNNPKRSSLRPELARIFCGALHAMIAYTIHPMLKKYAPHKRVFDTVSMEPSKVVVSEKSQQHIPNITIDSSDV